MSIEDTIREKYPQFGYMLQDPELRYLLIASLDPATGFDSGKFTANLMNTGWWKTHSSTQRNWIQQTALDPASAENQMNQKITQIRALVASSGLPLNEPQIRWEASLALQNGWNDMQLRQQLHLTSFAAGGTPGSVIQGGSIGTTAQQIRALAYDYLLPMSDQQAGNWAMEIFDGVKTLDDLRGTLAHSSAFSWAGKNPDMIQAIGRGVTPKQFVDPQIQAVASTLEMSPDQINLLAPKWSPMLNYTDKQGNVRMMTVPEAQIWARNQPEFEKTKQATDAAYQMADTLTKAMGERR